jgi:hypothetical protein
MVAEVMRDYTPQDYPRGFLANAQTHVLQLPHTYLVAEYWHNGPGAEPDLAAFANQAIPRLGEGVAGAWVALESADPPLMRSLASRLRSEVGRPHSTGASSGLLLGSADRFLTDLAMALDVRAGLAEVSAEIGDGGDGRAALRGLLVALRPYQQRLGFTDAYGGPLHTGLNQQVARLDDAGVNAVLAQFDDWRDPAARHGVLPRLLDAVEAYCDREQAGEESTWLPHRKDMP